jgi:hypothetical protein
LKKRVLNVAPEPIDVYHTERRVNDVDFHLDTRTAYKNTVAWGASTYFESSILIVCNIPTEITLETPLSVTSAGASITFFRLHRWRTAAKLPMWI